MPASNAGGFRVLGFPVHVRPGFVLFMVLIAALHADSYGLWLAGALAVLTLVHELGHAVVARWAGADAEISLEFMAGFASYRPTRPISRPVRALIAFAGPGVHIAAGTLALLALGHHPLDAPSWREPAAFALWWAGPVIGAINLLPVLPLDGGNIVTTFLERPLGERAESVMIWVSLGLTGAAALWTAVGEQTRGLTVFVALLLLFQLQALFAHQSATARSPFDEAAELLGAGREAKARRVLVNGLRRPGTTRQAPAPMTSAQAERLLGLLPEPLPSGDPWNEYVLTNLMLRTGHFERAAHYGADSYARTPHPLLAASIARAAGALGDEATAVAWLRTAADAGPVQRGLVKVIDEAPELAAVRARPEIAAIRARAAT